MAGPGTRRRLALGAAALVLLVTAPVVDLAAAWSRVAPLPAGAVTGSAPGGTTYLVLGSDSRERLTTAEEKRRYADATQSTGERADVVLLVRADASGDHAVALPRDLFLLTDRLGGDRLTTSLLRGVGTTTGYLCQALGVGVDHVLVVDFAAVVRAVDAVGGVEVRTDTPVRDIRSRLDLPTAGTHHLDGAGALAWVRSRHPEVLVDGTWRPAPWAGSSRADHLADVVAAVASALGHDPLAVHRALWDSSDRLRADAGLGPFDAARLGLALRSALQEHPLTQAPANLVDGPVPQAYPTERTTAALAAYRGGTCSASG